MRRVLVLGAILVATAAAVLVGSMAYVYVRDDHRRLKRIEQTAFETNAMMSQSVAQNAARHSELAERAATLEAQVSKLGAQEKHDQTKLIHVLDELRALKLAGEPERVRAIHGEIALLERELALYGDGDWNAWWKKLEPFRIALAA